MKYSILLIFFILLSCSKQKLEYKVDNQSLYLNIENDGKPIYFDKPFKTILRFENINIDGLSLLGPTTGTKFVSDNEIEIGLLSKKKFASKDEVEKKQIKLKVSFDGKDKKRKTHIFLIDTQ